MAVLLAAGGRQLQVAAKPDGKSVPVEPLDRHIAVMLAMLLSMAVLLNILSKHLSDLFSDRDFGLFTIVLEVATLSRMAFNFRLRFGLRYWLARARAGEEEVPPPALATGLCVAFDLLSTAAIAAAVFLLAPHVAAFYGAPQAAAYLRIVCPFLLFHAVQGVVETLFNASKRFALSGMALLTTQVAPLAGALAGGLLARPDGRLFAASLGYGLGLMVSTVAWTVPNLSKLSFCPHIWRHRQVFWQLARVAWPIYVGELVKGGLPPLLKLLAGVVALAEAGFLRIALVVISPAMMVAFAVRAIAIPLMAERNAAERSRMGDLLVRAHNFLLFPVVAVLWVAGPSFIRWYYHQEYHSAAEYLPVLLVMLMSNSFVRAASWVLVGGGSAASYVWIMAVVAVFSMPGMVISAFWASSVMGAAWWLAAGWFAGALITVWLAYRQGLRFNWLRSFVEPACWAVLVAAVVKVAQAQSVGMLLAAAALGLALPVAMVRRQLRTARAVVA